MQGTRLAGAQFRYKRVDILRAVTVNRATHAKKYEVARAKYMKALTEKLKRMLGQVVEGQDVVLNIPLRKPVEFLKEYDQAIRMLELTCDEDIELDGTTFARLVLDDWPWKEDFASSTGSYLRG
ncbi:MAG: hypothetical protein HS116_19305 [Planctomycetes bacterium]|nr:hypothetical protein [Planctomycetota bacterium]